MKLLTNGALLCYGLSLVGHVSKAAIGSFYMVLPAFNIRETSEQTEKPKDTEKWDLDVLMYKNKLMWII